jgi:hypothetical protein
MLFLAFNTGVKCLIQSSPREATNVECDMFATLEHITDAWAIQIGVESDAR